MSESKWREAVAEVLIAEGAGPGSSIHSWRCEHPDRYGPCSCVAEVADALSPVLAQMKREWQAEALREAADEYVAEHPIAGFFTHYFSGWLRDRAEASRQEGEW